MYTETLTLRRQGQVTGTDRYGNPIYGPPVEHQVPAWYEPTESTEGVAAQDQRVSGYWVNLPPTYRAPDDSVVATREAVTAADAVVIDGNEYDVFGDVGVTPRGFVLDTQVRFRVERVTG